MKKIVYLSIAAGLVALVALSHYSNSNNKLHYLLPRFVSFIRIIFMYIKGVWFIFYRMISISPARQEMWREETLYRILTATHLAIST